MNLINKTEEIRIKTQKHGKYRYISENSGVGFEWLSKFASGKIKNPGVINVSKLEDFFNKATS